MLPDDTSRLVLVIDQFEELFTLVEDESERRRFLANLVAALDDPHARVVVILTLRADSYHRPLGYAELAARLASSVVNVLPLTSDELESAAQEPAARSGVSLEPALLAELLADVIGEPGRCRSSSTPSPSCSTVATATCSRPPPTGRWAACVGRSAGERTTCTIASPSTSRRPHGSCSCGW